MCKFDHILFVFTHKSSFWTLFNKLQLSLGKKFWKNSLFDVRSRGCTSLGNNLGYAHFEFTRCELQERTITYLVNAIDSSGKSIRNHFVSILLVIYALAVIYPTPGRYLRTAQLELPFSYGTTFGWVKLLLALLLFSAAIGLDVKQIRTALSRPLLIITSLLIKLLVPAAVVLSFCLLPEALLGANTIPVIAGLALVAVMPAAGSVPVWTQASRGNVAIALGVVLGSTIIAPIWGPWFLDHLPLNTTGDLASQIKIDKVYFAVWVLVPSIAGATLRALLSDKQLQSLRPYLRLSNSILLLVLIYSFAAASLHGVLDRESHAELILAGLLCVTSCVISFTAGAFTSKAMKLDPEERSAIWYGIGMHNNGIALVIGEGVMEAESSFFLPIIGYALTQHLCAALINKHLFLKETDEEESKPISNESSVKEEQVAS
jgi:predicted Na+-dependent transporter